VGRIGGRIHGRRKSSRLKGGRLSGKGLSMQKGAGKRNNQKKRESVSSLENRGGSRLTPGEDPPAHRPGGAKNEEGPISHPNRGEGPAQ